jgi:peptidoglycan/xylan/chitin deacetylase (PgdA/CDA1 family)
MMLTFRRFTLVFFMLLLAMNLYSIFGCGVSETFLCSNMPLFYAVLISAYIGTSVIFAFLPCSGFHHPVLCRGKTNEKIIAVTFDDGPHAAHTPAILDILKKHQVPAAFFLTGKNVPGNEELVRRICSEGHLAGTHSWSHSRWFDFFTPAMMKREFIRSAETVKAVTGRSPLMFRPPYGVVNPMVARALRNMRLTVVCWSIRSFDTTMKDPDRILRRILSQVQPGSVILLHDHSAFSSSHLETMILKIREQGYQFASLEQILKIQAYEV